MQKILIISCLLFGLVIASPVMAAPFLVSDPNPGAETAVIIINDQEVGEFDCLADGSIHVDLAQFNLPDGEHTYKAYAKNVWGQSSVSDPFVNVKIVPASFTGLSLSN